MFKPKAIYFENKILEYPLGKELMEKYKEIPKIEIENHNNIEEMRKKENKEFQNMKRNLIIGIRKTQNIRLFGAIYFFWLYSFMYVLLFSV